MWIRTQNGNRLIDTTGGILSKYRVGNKYSIEYTEKLFSNGLIVAEYDREETRNLAFKLFEVALLDDQKAFSFQDTIILKTALENKGRLKGDKA